MQATRWFYFKWKLLNYYVNALNLPMFSHFIAQREEQCKELLRI